MTSMRRPRWSLAILGSAVAVVASLLWRAPEPDLGSVAAPAVAAAASLAAPLPPVVSAVDHGELAAAATLAHTGPAPAGAAVFSDGTWLPPLNGVTLAPPFPGFGDQPFAPVVRIDTDRASGLQWFIHANGWASSTYLSPSSDGVRSWSEPGWVVAQPVTSPPIQQDAR